MMMRVISMQDDTRRLQKTRKTTAKLGGLCEERSMNGRGWRKVGRKGQQQGAVEENPKLAVRQSDK